MSRFFARVPVVRACLVAAALTGPGCVKEIPSEERLDRETADIAVKPGIARRSSAKINCDDAGTELVPARDVNRPETERAQSYMNLYDSLQNRTKTFEEAYRPQPGPQLRPRTAATSSPRGTPACSRPPTCALEFETYTRELVDVPTVQEIKGGNTDHRRAPGLQRAARGDRDLLAPDDKEALLNKLASAEKRIEGGTPSQQAAADGAQTKL